MWLLSCAPVLLFKLRAGIACKRTGFTPGVSYWHILLSQVMQQASWDQDSGRWCLLEPADVPRLVTSMDFARQQPADITAKAPAPPVALLAIPPWESRSSQPPMGPAGAHSLRTM
jgi:hypothetical protein